MFYKNLSLILPLLLLSFLSFAQRNSIKITMPEMTYLFKGYDVKIEISPTRKIKRYTIECVGCSKVQKISKTSNHWIIRPSDSDSIVIMVKNRFGRVLQKQTVRVFEPPLPILFLDSLDAQNVIRTVPETLSLKYQSWVPLTVNFLVVSWSCTIDSQSFSGMGSLISDEVRNVLSDSKNGYINFDILYRDPFGFKKLKDIWEFCLP